MNTDSYNEIFESPGEEILNEIREQAARNADQSVDYGRSSERGYFQQAAEQARKQDNPRQLQTVSGPFSVPAPVSPYQPTERRHQRPHRLTYSHPASSPFLRKLIRGILKIGICAVAIYIAGMVFIQTLKVMMPVIVMILAIAFILKAVFR